MTQLNAAQQRAHKVLAQRELARRRLLHFTKLTHPSYEAGWVHEDICARLEKFSQDVKDRKSPRLMLLMPPRHGKLMADSTPVRTREGWKTHGQLRVGDFVVGMSGRWVRVSHISPPGVADVAVTLDTGESFLVHENHEWDCLVRRASPNIYKYGNRKYFEYRTVETKEFLAWHAKTGTMRYKSNKYAYRFSLPAADLAMNLEIIHDVRARLRAPGKGATCGNKIVDVFRVAPEHAQLGRCIQVEADDGLYLVGRSLVPTHNSELASIRFPAWHLGHNPSHEIINVGYNLDLPMKFSRKVREVVRDGHYMAMFPDSRLDPDSQSAEAWNTTKGGGFTAAGVGGGITGKGAHILIIDDPLKNMEEADSIDRRDLLDDWYQSTAYTRLAPGGGVLFIECLTGDTPVRLPDGTDQRLDTLRPGDEVATYERGHLTTTTVAAIKNNGRDKVYKITTSSGRIVRANGRHPFLVATNGELKWIRTQALTTTHKIVTVRGNGVNGKGSLVQQMVATSQLSAEGYVTPTTVKSGGRQDIEHQALAQKALETHISNVVMESTSSNTTGFKTNKVVYAPSANNPHQQGGMESSSSTIATTLPKYEDYSATHVTSESDTLNLSPIHVPLPNTYDFTLEDLVSVEFDGEDEVFDLQIDRTENFIANGLANHNTWWNDDDLAGRLQQRMANDKETDQFDVVRYPALSEKWEYRDEVTKVITRADEALEPLDPNLTLLRPVDTCLHEARYPTEALKRIRSNMNSPRIWSALYQQNPVPDEGMYFRKEFFRYQRVLPSIGGYKLFTAWDFAIGEKQQNDWTVGVTLLQDHTDTLYLMDVERFRGDSMQIVESILDTAIKWGSDPTTDYMLGVEDGQIWRAIEPLLKKRMQERKQYIAYEPLKPLTDKMARARPLQGRMQQGKVIFPEEAAWLKQAEQELLRFPAGAHDDVVDALSWAVRLCIGRTPPDREEVKQPASWKDRLSVELGDYAVGHMAA